MENFTLWYKVKINFDQDKHYLASGLKIGVTVDCGDLCQILEWWTGNSQSDTASSCLNRCAKQKAHGPERSPD